MRLLGGLYNKTKRSSFYLPEDNVFLGNISFNLGYFYYSNKNRTLSESTAFTDFYVNEEYNSFYAVTGTTDTIVQYNFTNPEDISSAYLMPSTSVSTQDTAPTGMYFSSDGTKAYVIGQSTDTIYQYTLTTAWDITTASYASKSFSIASQETSPTGLFFKPDGTKVYIVGNVTTRIYQYSLSTAWDISTASYENKNFLVSAYDNNPQGIFIGSDGTKLYLVGQGNSTPGNVVYQFTLSTDWDISTAFSDLKTASIASQDNSPWGITFKSDGTKVYVAGDTSDYIYQYSLSTAWDVSTLSYDNKRLFLGGFDTTNPSLFFKPDGTKLFVFGNTSDSIRSYTLLTAWDVSTAYYQLSTTQQETTTTGLDFSSDGTKAYIVGVSFDSIHQYTLNTPWDTNTAFYSGKSVSVLSTDTLTMGVKFSSDGTKAFTIGDTINNVYQYTLSTAWDVSTASYASKALSVSTQDGSPSDLAFSSDGTKLYVLGDANNTIYQYTLPTAWDLTGATYASKSFSVNTQESIPQGLAFSSDGTKAYVIGMNTDTVYQYGLTTAWDISTASYASKSLSVTTLEATPQGISFSSDGTKCYVIGSTNNRVLKYNLSTAWDISTAVYDPPERYVVPSTLGTDNTQLFFNDTGTLLYTSENNADRIFQYKLSTAWNVSTAFPNRQTFAVGAQEAASNDLRFSSDGTKAYVSGLSTIFQYNLSSAWNISTATYASKSLSTSGQDTGSRGFAFKDDGTKVYMVGVTNDSIYQYSLSTAWDISTGSYESKSLVVSGRENNPQAIYFNNNGTSVYVVGDTNDRIDQFDLSTAWDISTGSYASKTFTISGQEATVTSLFFTSDGSGFYILGTTNDTIYQYSLTLAWDISTASYTGKSFSVGTLETAPTGLHFSSDGTSCYILGQTGDTINQLNLAVAWDISTANLGFLSVSAQDTGLFSFCFNSTGTRLYVLGVSGDRIYQYNLPHAWNVGTATFSTSVYIGRQEATPTGIFLGNAGTSMFIIGSDKDIIYSYILNTPDEISSIYIPVTPFTLDSAVTDITFNSSGNKFFTTGNTGDVINEYSVGTSWDITTATNPSKSSTISVLSTSPQSLYIKSDGLKLYLVGSAPSASIYELNLGSSYDISTLKTNIFSISSQETAVTGLTFSSDGTKCYIVGTTNDTIYQYNLGTAWDINTATYASKSFSVSSLDTSPSSLSFNDDGTRLYVTGDTNDRIFEIRLATPWDLGTAGFRYNLLISAQDSAPTDIVFGNNGFKLYLSGNTNDRVFEYNLSTAYDIRTASYSSNFVSTSGLDTATTGVFISSDGRNLYTTGDTNDRVYQLKLTTPWDVSTAYSILNRRVSSISQEEAPQGLAIGDSGTKMYIVGDDSTAPVTGNRIYQYTLSTPYNVNTATYANKSFNAGSFLADGCTSLEFNPTGTKMFVANYINDTIREYLLTTAWDVATAKTPYSSRNISAQTGSPKDVFLGSNGTKCYVLSDANIVYQYTLSTANDIATATYDNKSFTASNYDSIVTGISFKSDGTKLYTTGTSSDRVGEFILSTPWDVSTASSPVKSLSVSARDSTAREITFSSDGTKLYYLGGTNATIYQYTLTTPFNISTATFASKSLSVNTQESTPQGLAFSSDGTKVYVTGSTSDNIRQYTLSTAWEINTGSYASKTLSVLSQDTTSTALQFSSDGTKAYMLGDTNNTIYQYTLTTAWDISTGSYASKSFSVGTQEITPTGMVFNSDGTKVYIVGSSNDTIYQYSLGTAWDISTASYDSKSISISFYEANASGLAINSDGTRVYVIGTTNITVYQIDLGVAYDISTANVGFTSVLSQDTTSQALCFKDDGTRMYVLGISNDRVFEYNLSVAWQVSTAVYSRQSQVLAETTGGGISFSSDGTKFYVAGQTNDRIYQYNLTTAWDVSASTVATLSAYVGFQEINTEGLTFSSDGLNVYVLGSTNDIIYQYPIETAWDIGTANTGYISTSSQDGTVQGFCFSSDGTKIFMVGSGNTTKYFYQYDLAKAYLVSSGSFTKSSTFVLSNTEATPRGITINPAGTKLFVTGSSGDNIYEFGLSTANDIGGTITLNTTRSVTYVTSEPVDIRFNNDGKILYLLTTTFVHGFDLEEAYNLASINIGSHLISGQDSTPYGIQFSTNGDKFYVLGQTNDRIYQYDLSYNWLISSASYPSKFLSVTTQESLPTGFTFGDSGTKVYVIGLSLIHI